MTEATTEQVGRYPAEQPVPAGATGRPPLRGLVLMMLFDIGLPLGAYYLLSGLGVTDWLALTAGGLVAGVRAVVSVVRKRSLDPFAVFILAMFAIGVLLAFVTGDARFVLAKDSAGGALAGLVMLGSCAGTPLLFYAARAFASGGDPAKLAEFDRMWAAVPGFRAAHRFLTVVWGLGLLADASVRVALIYGTTLPVHTLAGLSSALQILTFAGLIVFTMRYARRAQARRAARVAAAPVAAPAGQPA